ncbi:hypothetical protein FHR62_003622 [Xanthomonas arboricola]|nr:hypothetical protein [Xanthomonas arboricola]
MRRRLDLPTAAIAWCTGKTPACPAFFVSVAADPRTRAYRVRRAGRAAGRRGGLHPSGCCCRAGIAACRVAPVTVIGPGWSFQNQLSATATATQPRSRSRSHAAAVTAQPQPQLRPLRAVSGERRAAYVRRGCALPATRLGAGRPTARRRIASHRAQVCLCCPTVDHACHLSDRSQIADPLRTTPPVFCCTRTTMRWRKYRQFAGARRLPP